MTEKIPPVLGVEEIINLVTEYHFSGEKNRHILADKVAQAQLKKAQEHYEPLIQRLEVESGSRLELLNMMTDRCTELRTSIEQAKEEVASEIFEEIEKNKPHHLWYPAQSDWDKDFTIFKDEKWWQSLKAKHLKG